MCVGVPMQVVSLQGGCAVAEVDGVKREASLMLPGDEVASGDQVMVHAGFAISKLDQQDALETLALMRLVFAPENVP